MRGCYLCVLSLFDGSFFVSAEQSFLQCFPASRAKIQERRSFPAVSDWRRSYGGSKVNFTFRRAWMAQEQGATALAGPQLQEKQSSDS